MDDISQTFFLLILLVTSMNRFQAEQNENGGRLTNADASSLFLPHM